MKPPRCGVRARWGRVVHRGGDWWRGGGAAAGRRRGRGVPEPGGHGQGDRRHRPPDWALARRTRLGVEPSCTSSHSPARDPIDDRGWRSHRRGVRSRQTRRRCPPAPRTSPPTTAGRQPFRSCSAVSASHGPDCTIRTSIMSRRSAMEWRKRLGVEPSLPAVSGERPILKTGRATGPRSLPGGVRAVRTGSMRDVGGPRGGQRSVGAKWEEGPGPRRGRDVQLAQPSMSRTSPARGPLAESSAVNSTRCPSRSSSNTALRTALRWKKCSDPALVANEPEPLVDQEPCDCAGRHDRVLRLIRRP